MSCDVTCSKDVVKKIMKMICDEKYLTLLQKNVSFNIIACSMHNSPTK